MHQSFETPGTWRGHSLSVRVKVSEVPRHQKYWVKSPPLGTQLYKPKSCVCRSSCESFLNPLGRAWRAFLNEDNMAVSYMYANNLCQMLNYQVAWKCDLWQIKCEFFTHPPTYWAKKCKQVFPPPSRGTQAGEYEVIISPLFSRHAWGGWGFQMTGALDIIQ